MAYEITKKPVSAQPVLVRRFRVTRAEIAKAIGEGLGSVFKHAQQHGIPLAGPPFARYSDVGEQLTIEPGMCIAGTAPVETHDTGDVRVDTLPGGFVARTLHAGSYDSLHEAYAALQSWMKESGLTASGAPWEVYLTDPMATPNVADWRTEVCWPCA